jgi:hypothetical protein
MDTICKPNHLLVVVPLLSAHTHTQDTSLVALKKRVLKSNPRLALNKAIPPYHSSAVSVLFVCISTDLQEARSWLRNRATSRKIAGSIPDGATGIFHCLIPSGRTMTLRLTQPLTEMSTKNISWGVGKDGRCVRLTTLSPSCAHCLEIWDPQPPGTLSVCPAVYRDGSTFTCLQIEQSVKISAALHLTL